MIKCFITIRNQVKISDYKKNLLNHKKRLFIRLDISRQYLMFLLPMRSEIPHISPINAGKTILIKSITVEMANAVAGMSK